MKQIFDWLREAICEGSQCINERYYTTVVHSLSCVNEAEAKWEAECCEWTPTKNRVFFTLKASCGDNYFSDGDDYNFCPYCGKPIKILEVE